MSFEVGQVIDHYRLERELASTPVLTVFVAFDLRLLRRVALKELASALSADATFRSRFAHDAARAAQLDHPSIASVFDSNERDGSLYFVTKYVEGCSLAELLRSRPVPIHEAMRYLDQVAGALDYAHRRGVIHGDVSPARVLIATDDDPHSAVLFDVGIGKEIEADDDGGPNWFHPANGDWGRGGSSADLDERRVDLVGLARTAFELLTRRAPQDALASASMLEPQLSSNVDAVFAAALGDVDREMTCAQFVGALRRSIPAAVQAEPTLVPGSPLPPPEPATAVVSPAQAQVPTNPARRRRSALIASAVTVAVLVTGVAWWQGGRPTQAEGSVSPPPPPTVPSTVAPVAAPSTPSPSPAEPTTTAQPTTTSLVTTPAATPPTEPTTAPAPSLNDFGDIIGQPVVEPQSAPGRAAVALQERLPPVDFTDDGTPAAFYAEWLRLTTVTPSTPVVATADGYSIDAGTPADLSAFQVDEDGLVASFIECANGSCASLTDDIVVSPDCSPGPDCNAFATDDDAVLAVLRATVLLRNPSITLIFSLTSSGQPVVAVSDPNNTVRYDAETGWFAVTLAAAPPEGTDTLVTVTYEDGSRSKMMISYG